MKRSLVLFLAALMSTAFCSAAMSNSKVRKETRFLTDKMAYELKLNTEQYNDVYEINYDFVSGIRYLMDDVMRGEEWAMDHYYDCLDVRNDDLRWVMSNRQYSRFMQAAYFYRPVYISGGRWSFRVYITYTNVSHFYFPVPYHYRTYCGGHYRTNYANSSYYRGRYNHPSYNGHYRIRDAKSYLTSRHSDFGAVNIRPNSGTRPTERRNSTSSSRPASNENNGSRRSNSGSSRRVNVEEKNENKNSSSVRSSERSSRRSNTSSGSRSNGSSRSSERLRR